MLLEQYSVMFIQSNIIQQQQYSINNIVRMSQVSTIDYKIPNSDKYALEDGSKQFSKICQKSKQLRFLTSQDKFQFECVFVSPAIISYVDLKVRFTTQIIINFYNQDSLQPIATLQTSFTESEAKQAKARNLKLQENSGRFTRAKVNMLNYPKPQSSWICYIIFKGFKQQDKKKSIKKVNNVSDNDTFEPGYVSKKKIQEQKKVFENRSKEKDSIEKKYNLIRDIETDKHLFNSKNDKTPYKSSSSTKKQTVIIEEDEDEQLKRVIELSKKEMQQQTSNRNKQQQFQEKQKTNLIDIEDNQAFSYEVSEWDKVKKVFDHVNVGWVEAQKKLQRDRNIQSRHSLADKVDIKLFNKCEFCINNIAGSEKGKLIEMISKMGGRIIDEPINGCYIITNKMQGAKINLSRSLKNIKYLKPDYILVCMDSKMKVDDDLFRV